MDIIDATEAKAASQKRLDEVCESTLENTFNWLRESIGEMTDRGRNHFVVQGYSPNASGFPFFCGKANVVIGEEVRNKLKEKGYRTISRRGIVALFEPKVDNGLHEISLTIEWN